VPANKKKKKKEGREGGKSQRNADSPLDRAIGGTSKKTRSLWGEREKKKGRSWPSRERSGFIDAKMTLN